MESRVIRPAVTAVLAVATAALKQPGGRARMMQPSVGETS